MLNYKYYICTFSLFEKKLSILTWLLLEGISIVNLKPTINYNNILIKALFIKSLLWVIVRLTVKDLLT